MYSFVLALRWPHFSRLLLSLTLVAAALPLRATEAYPAKPIKLIVPFASGGSTDMVARLVAEGMRKTLGQAVVVDNRAGAGGMLGTEAVAQASPDGYTIGMATVSTLTVNPGLYTRAPAVVARLQPVVNLVTMPSVYMVHPSVGVSTFAEFLLKAKAQPQGYSTGVPGIGTLGHLMISAFNETLHTRLQIVPYRGSGPALNDALAGVVQVMTDQLPSSMSFVKSGRLIPLAIAAHTRAPELPHVPTLKELGYGELNSLGISWFGLVVPAGTPAPVVLKIRTAAMEAVRQPDVLQRLNAMGVALNDADPRQFAAQIATETQRHKVLLDKLGVKPE